MKLFLNKFIFVFLIGVMPMKNYGQESEMKLVKGGVYIPLYGIDTIAVKVGSFFMDEYPVTNEEYVAFVKKYPKWQRSNVKQLFAEKSYLRYWKSDTNLGIDILPNEPVTSVSWFAANDYCECQGKRLPTIDEWEYAAMANETQADARELKSYNSYILSWYEKPKNDKSVIGSTFRNYWGIYDLHGLVWEWTFDFNSVLVSGESRKDVDNDSNLFCGSAAIGATDLMNYAAFMRYATRGSIKAKYTMKNLGFRCVKDVPMKTNRL